jgi:hypothetical protein
MAEEQKRTRDETAPMEEKKRIRVTDPVEARMLLINGDFHLPDENKAGMKEIGKALEDAAVRIHAVAKKLPCAGVSKDGKPLPGYDTGRLIAALDTIQHAKDIACVSFILPYAEKDV